MSKELKTITGYIFVPFEKKYIVGFYNASNHADFTWSEEKYGHDDYPMFFKSKADAAIEIADHIRSVAHAVKQGDMDENSLETMEGYFIAECSLFENGTLVIFDPNPEAHFELLFNDSIEKLIN